MQQSCDVGNSESAFFIFFISRLSFYCIILFQDLPFPFYNCCFPFPVLYASLEMYVLNSCAEPTIPRYGFFGGWGVGEVG